MIHCEDKKGNAIVIENKPSVEIRITDKNGKRINGYFDGVYIEDSILFIPYSRFFPSLMKEVELGNIKKVEIQNSKRGIKLAE